MKNIFVSSKELRKPIFSANAGMSYVSYFESFLNMTKLVIKKVILIGDAK